MPVTAALTGVLLPAVGYVWFARLRVAVIGMLVLLVSVFQMAAERWVTAIVNGEIHLEEPLPLKDAAVRLAGLTTFNFALCLLAHALRWGIRAERSEVFDRNA